ncbi:beta-ketoacyl synthase N-terminal-like domain-containing protein, partial [Streptomyces sp. GC420]|uniref:beta-ketoacyl synthase N-terminal-like domain-containing protein n=1 Tax=Streptomyces sp. GC420 TaxID=2697568 RepID=UPI001414D0F3
MIGPNGETTLLQVLLDAARETPGQVVVHVRGDGSELDVTLRELADQSLRVAGGLLAAGASPGTCLPLLADRSEDFQPMFWGALAAGLVPVPLAPETRRVLSVWEHLGRPPLLADRATAPLLAELPPDATALHLDAVREGTPPGRLPEPAPDDVAFLQFSSGSTGTPKGVELTHAAVLSNLGQIRTAARLTADDVVMSWMPYFHDMGLIGTHLAPLAARAKQVKLGPLSFAKRPRTWFDTAARHGATVLSAANFALALAARRVPDEELQRLDLSRVRLVLVGAEPIAAPVWREFARKTLLAGMDATAMQPVYGLAEATLAVTFPPLGKTAAPLVLDREALSRGRAVDAAPSGTPGSPGTSHVEVMDVGLPVPGCAVRVVGEDGSPLGDRRVGHIEVRGPQVARGYHLLREETAAAFADGWLRTGDMGFLHGGRLCVTGRHKDVLFINGRQFHASDIETVVAGTPGLPPGATAVIGSTDPLTGAERVAVFVQWARPPKDTAPAVLEQVVARVREALAHDDVRVVPLPPGAFPRTTSGKLQRRRMRARFEAGAYAGRGTRPAAETALPAVLAAAARTAQDARDARTGAGAAAPGLPAVPAPPAAGARSRTAAPEPRPRQETERAVRDVWAHVLGLPATRIGPRDRFFALGGTSLKAMEVLAALEDTFGAALPPSVMRDRDTVTALTDHLMGSDPQPADRGTDLKEAGTAVRAEVSPAGPAGGQDGPPHDSRTPVAITAMACRFPGADTPEAFWDRLAAGHDAVTGVPGGRWPGSADTTARWGGFLDDPAGFDADYFGIGPDEARVTDPQARVFLELAHEALERAGYAGPRRSGRRIGVFAAVGESGYRELLGPGGVPGTTAAAAGPAAQAVPAPSALLGNLPNLIAARVAQTLDLDGPALAVDTACSSALVALHLARRSLQDGECDIAVVGGVNLNLTPTGYRLLEEARALSPTGRCHAFSSRADGFVPGEGGAAIVLTRLDDAHRAGDPVLALLRGTAVNNDGRSLSLMAPNPLRQREVIARAYEDAGIDPAAVSYVEAHGTGTAIGDPIELKSLAHAFPPRADGRPRLLGSVKTNLGHLLNAAGMPALVKVVLALGHRQLPASLHHAPPAAGIDGAGFSVVARHRDWVEPGTLVAGVNAFGFGGTNAHAILEEAPPAPSAAPVVSAAPVSSATSD